MKVNVKLLVPLTAFAAGIMLFPAHAQTMQPSHPTRSAPTNSAPITRSAPTNSAPTGTLNNNGYNGSTNNGATDRPGNPSSTPAGSATGVATTPDRHAARTSRLQHLRETSPNRAYAPLHRRHQATAK